MANPPPPVLASAKVLEYAWVNEGIGYRGQGLLFVNGVELGPVPCLAIARDLTSEEILLFYCDNDWDAKAAGGYASIEEAKRRAEHMYPGVSERWTVASGPECDAIRDVRDLPGPKCSFCGKHFVQVERMIEKNGPSICNECVTDCWNLLQEG